MLNIVIPMAGAGSRFSKAGYTDPKPLIPVHHIPMIRLVIENLRPKQPHRFIFICQRSHISMYKLEEKLSQWAPGSALIQIDGLTEGAACTVLAASHLIDNEDPLMIANSDQYVDVDINDYINKLNENKLDGLIMTMKANDPKWSFVGHNSTGHVDKVVEKEVISNEATVGIYNFKRGADFVSAAKDSIALNQRVNGEFYVAPVYNLLITHGQRIGVYNIGEERAGMYGLGIPDDLEWFLNIPLSRKVTEAFQC
ncbi:glycosyltransferase family 2 protein [Aquitalea sp. ASV11]|uniref:glycosyltransferase family 2 protein n=1 Tax=Aquitalea sp. ASV11 TaxID=2795103 RepID=UPI0018EC22EE|nr:glycosyltransferase family 2 protein [Aquitalea sp. ASV11]